MRVPFLPTILGVVPLLVMPALAADELKVRELTGGGVWEIAEGEKPVLRYNYHTVQPPAGFLDQVSPGNRKYAQPRSDYIHPLFGLDGETLTADWSKDHPHHRGVYWAWPEVDYRGQRGDLHALQNVFARPTDRVETRTGSDYAEIEADNVWQWEDQTPIVRETAVLRAWRSGEHGRFVDLVLKFQAIEDDVALARRDTTHYGGLNLRLAPIKGLKISNHTDPAGAQPRVNWGAAGGTWATGSQPAALAILEHAANPEFPGQWIEYPVLPWFQPTFPTAGTRYVLKKEHPLELRYRIWIRRGEDFPDADVVRQWQAYQQDRKG
jgi:hypothetical protein